MICPICKTKNNYYAKTCKKCGSKLDGNKIEERFDDESSDDKPIFIYQTKEEKEIKHRINKKGLALLSIVAFGIIVMLVVGWKSTTESKSADLIIEDSIKNSEMVETMNEEKETKQLNEQQKLDQDKKKQN